MQGEQGEGQGVIMSGPKAIVRREAGLEASMAHVRQDAASGWSLGPDMTWLCPAYARVAPSQVQHGPNTSAAPLPYPL